MYSGINTKILAVFMSVIFLSSCKDDIRTSLNIDERKEVNELYKSQLDSINKLMIKECDDRRASTFDNIVDSLKTTRLEEIKLITKSKKDEK